MILKRRVELNLKECVKLGIIIYRHRDRSDFNIQRFLVFLVRAFSNNKEIKNLHLFFRQNSDLREIEKENAIFYEQLTRHIFYHKSTISENSVRRVSLGDSTNLHFKMDKDQIIQITEEFIKSKLTGEGSGHDWWHVYRVWKKIFF